MMTTKTTLTSTTLATTHTATIPTKSTTVSSLSTAPSPCDDYNCRLDEISLDFCLDYFKGPNDLDCEVKYVLCFFRNCKPFLFIKLFVKNNAIYECICETGN